jgi:hypothetical protein
VAADIGHHHLTGGRGLDDRLEVDADNRREIASRDLGRAQRRLELGRQLRLARILGDRCQPRFDLR